MRNYSFTVRNNRAIAFPFASDDADIAKAKYLLLQAMEVSDERFVTPSEEEVLSSFLEWVKATVGKDWLSYRGDTAFVYANLNTGYNLVFVLNAGYGDVLLDSLF
jgi:hypothetical protein